MSIRKRGRVLGFVAIGVVPILTLGTLGLQAVSAGAATTDVAVTWQVTQDWGSGFQANVAVTNNLPTPLDPWLVSFASGSKVTSIWDASMTSTSRGFSATGPSWSRALAPGATARFGLIGQSVNGSPTTPFECSVAGRSCVITASVAPSTPAAPSAPAMTPTTPLPTATPIGTATGRTLVAPYVDMGLWPPADLNAISAATGVRAFTAAFIVQDASKPCVPAWGGYSAYAIGGGSDFYQSITGFKAQGGRVIPSFGGASGSELADNCTDEASLLAAYQKVIDRYGLDRIDFDIEGAAVANSTANQRRARVLAALQKDYAARGRTIEVSLTLPVMPSGLDANGVRALREFASAGVKVAAVNVMAMDYGQGYTDMGTHAITAAQGTVNQMKAIPAFAGLSDATLFSKVGITPMIGQNDVPGEVFSLADASKVASFAKANGVGQLSWWEMTRDKPCTSSSQGLYLCTYQSAPQWAFSKAFVAGVGTSTAPNPAPGDPSAPASPSATPTPSPAASSPSSSGLAVRVNVTSDWGSGRNVELLVTNLTGAPITGWSVSMPWSGTVTSLWNAKGGSAGGTLVASNESWNGSLGAGSTASVGFGESGTLVMPSTCTAVIGGINVRCTIS